MYTYQRIIGVCPLNRQHRRYQLQKKSNDDADEESHTLSMPHGLSNDKTCLWGPLMTAGLRPGQSVPSDSSTGLLKTGGMSKVSRLQSQNGPPISYTILRVALRTVSGPSLVGKFGDKKTILKHGKAYFPWAIKAQLGSTFAKVTNSF
ncbi:hypothetical protein BJ546DRAFT_946896 [Cryomyces antarcticus]